MSDVVEESTAVRRRPRRRQPRTALAGRAALRRIALELRELRRARGMTQRELAATSGVQQAEISRVETARSNPTLSTLAALARALDAEVSLAQRGGEPAGRRAASSGLRATPGRDLATARGAQEPRPAKFLCLVCAETLMEEMARPAARRHLAQYRAFTARLRQRGQLLGCNRLLPAEAAATVRVRRGDVSVTDGPFAETKELIGGYFLIEARDRAEAVRLAAEIPGARLGCVEVRPIAEDAATLRALGLAAPPPRR